MSTNPLDIQLTETQREQLAKIADESGKPWPTVLSEALVRFRRTQNGTAGSPSSESFFDIASRKGLIGAIKGGSPDVSTNPEYMEGFGAIT